STAGRWRTRSSSPSAGAPRKKSMSRARTIARGSSGTTTTRGRAPAGTSAAMRAAASAANDSSPPSATARRSPARTPRARPGARAAGELGQAADGGAHGGRNVAAPRQHGSFHAMSRLVVFLVVAGLSVPAAAQNKLAGEVDALARQVSKLRGLPVKRPIARGVLTRDQIEKRILGRIAEDYAEADVAGEERCMKRLGLFPADLDYKDVMVKLLREQVAGFYDPYRKELYLADWIADEMQKIVMVHEIDHALQDQSFDLVKFTQPKKDNGDEQVARQALVEGDGVAVMFEYMMPGSDPWADDRVANMMGLLSGLSGGAEFDKAPLLLRETLLFSYEKGLRFVAA